MMGPPGAGKGTQAKFVAEHFKIPAISTGDIFRANVSQGTELGVEAKRYMDAGEYVPDEVTNLMVRNRIDEPDAVAGFLLDGYPRTLAQVEELDGMIEFTGHRLDAVVVLTVDREEIVRAAAAARRGRGSRGRHRGRHPAPPGGLRRADRAADRRSTASAGSSSRSTAWARSTRSPSASSTRWTTSPRADRPSALGGHAGLARGLSPLSGLTVAPDDRAAARRRLRHRPPPARARAPARSRVAPGRSTSGWRSLFGIGVWVFSGAAVRRRVLRRLADRVLALGRQPVHLHHHHDQARSAAAVPADRAARSAS